MSYIPSRQTVLATLYLQGAKYIQVNQLTAAHHTSSHRVNRKPVVAVRAYTTA